ncbi:MAG: cell wall hydrolase, partial [Bartonella sp.]|nr:cell wall hydrolase [Bartonella sp.]
PKTICGVVGQHKQFAPGVLTRPMLEKASVARVKEAADAVLRGERDKKSKNAMFFHTAGLSFPYQNMHYVRVAGGNAFYEKRLRNGSLQVPVNDRPYDVAFAFSQERSGNMPNFMN